jgi:hypothetical protein
MKENLHKIDAFLERLGFNHDDFYVITVYGHQISFQGKKSTLFERIEKLTPLFKKEHKDHTSYVFGYDGLEIKIICS